MKTQPIGNSSLLSTRLAYGCWRVAGADHPRDVTDEKIAIGRKAIAAAFDAGYTLFDNADIYCRGVCETILGMSLKEIGGMRNRVLIATKCGIIVTGDPSPDSPGRYDFSASHIIGSCERSLKRLGIETIDLYQLHRPDVLMNPSEVAGAFDQLRRSGKVRAFGVSNFLPSQLQTLADFCPMPLIVNQVEISVARLDCFNDGTLDQCLRDNITPLAWSPLGQGWVGTGSIHPSDPKLKQKQNLIQTLDQIASKFGVPRATIAYAWLLKHPSRIIPIIGSNDPQRIRDAIKADDIELDREDWYRLLIAARGERMP